MRGEARRMYKGNIKPNIFRPANTRKVPRGRSKCRWWDAFNTNFPATGCECDGGNNL